MNDRKKKLQLGNAILNGCLFLLSGFDFITQGKIVFGLLQVAGSALNIFDGINLKMQIVQKKRLYFYIGILNIIIALTIAFDYFQAGKKYIQYVWVLVAIISIIGLVIRMKRKEKDLY